MPTYDELNELRTQCTWAWTMQNGVNGYKVTGPSGASIFLPAAACRDGSSLDGAGCYGCYWSSTPNNYNIGACSLIFGSIVHNMSCRCARSYGLSVRSVIK